MLRARGAIFAVLLAVAPVVLDSAAAEPAVDVSGVIAAFRPPWLPAKGELPRIVVVLAPIPAVSGAPDRWHNEGRSRMTAAYLYHLVKSAGGEAVVDDGSIGIPAGQSPEAALAELCTTARCHMLLRIGFGSVHRGDSGRPGTAGGEAAALSRALAESLGRAVGSPDASRPGAFVKAVPSADVRVTVPLDAHAEDDGVPAHRVMAERLYRGILAFVRAAYPDLEASRLRRWPDAATRPALPQIDPSPQAKLDKAAHAVWPGGDLPIEKAPWYCATYRATALSDRTIVHFEPQAVIEGDTVVLRGTSSVAPLCQSMQQALEKAGVARVRNEMRILPDRKRLGEDLFGACVAPMALTYARPLPVAPVQTQLLYGEPLFLLDRVGGYYLVQAGDGYWGWVREDAVRPMARGQFRRYTAANQAVFLEDVDLVGVCAYRAARLPFVSRDGGVVTLMRPDGREVRVPASAVRVIDESATVDQRLRTALTMLYVPYVFGGRSPIGLDCSGFVGSLSEQADVKLARDAAQQFASGRLVATSWYRDGLRAGDRVYFLDAAGKVFHTGLMISPTHFVHSSPPCVQINSFREGDPLYSAKWDAAFLAAKRP